jgi:hypothetical protein
MPVCKQMADCSDQRAGRAGSNHGLALGEIWSSAVVPNVVNGDRAVLGETVAQGPWLLDDLLNRDAARVAQAEDLLVEVVQELFGETCLPKPPTLLI